MVPRIRRAHPANRRHKRFGRAEHPTGRTESNPMRRTSHWWHKGESRSKYLNGDDPTPTPPCPPSPFSAVLPCLSKPLPILTSSADVRHSTGNIRHGHAENSPNATGAARFRQNGSWHVVPVDGVVRCKKKVVDWGVHTRGRVMATEKATSRCLLPIRNAIA